jgi:hypothetical protein
VLPGCWKGRRTTSVPSPLPGSREQPDGEPTTIAIAGTGTVIFDGDEAAQDQCIGSTSATITATSACRSRRADPGITLLYRMTLALWVGGAEDRKLKGAMIRRAPETRGTCRAARNSSFQAFNSSFVLLVS